MQHYLFQSHQHVMGETDSESCILCQACKDAWQEDRANAADTFEPADSDLECENCGA